MRKSNSDTTFNKKDPKGSTNDTRQQKKLPQDKTGNQILNDVNTAL